MRRIAVVGSGIAGLAAAHRLSPHARVTLLEADGRFGGHAHTVDVTLQGVTHGVDTGFLVFNPQTYPNLVALLAELGVDTAPAEMSFSVQVPAADLEWSGRSPAAVFAQPRNLWRPGFWRMLAEVLRFNRTATALAREGRDEALAEPLGDFLARHRFAPEFVDWYLLPMTGCIWSCPTQQMLRFPVGTLIRFCHNHGLLQIANQPPWFTVAGGSRRYVQRIVDGLDDARRGTPVRQVRRLPGGAGVVVATDAGSERFDEVVLACHSDQSLALLADATPQERAVLQAVRYQPNRAVLHTDASVLPRRRAAWAAWNYVRAADAAREQAAVGLHYLINRLQPLPWREPVIVSLNPDPERAPQPGRVIADLAYAHPVFDLAALAAQRQLPQIQGRSGVWFCGAWAGHGFHEDGLKSALAVVQGLRERGRLAGAPTRAAA